MSSNVDSSRRTAAMERLSHFREKDWTWDVVDESFRQSTPHLSACDAPGSQTHVRQERIDICVKDKHQRYSD
jgi:hypothetical protein